jgi:hypothetical protein
VSDFPLQGFYDLGPYPERPTLLMVWEGPITQDIAAVLIKCQQNSAVLGGIVVVGKGVIGRSSLGPSPKSVGMSDSFESD